MSVSERGVRIVLDTGHRPLSSNRRVHWSGRRAEHERWRMLAAARVRQQCPGWRGTVEAVDLLLTVHPPDERRRDSDNLVAHCLKPIKDGVADALGLADDTDSYVTWRLRLGEPARRWTYILTLAPRRLAA